MLVMLSFLEGFFNSVCRLYPVIIFLGNIHHRGPCFSMGHLLLWALMKPRFVFLAFLFLSHLLAPICLTILSM